jgi:hypothetical protein
MMMIVYIKEFINGRELLRDRKEDGVFFSPLHKLGIGQIKTGKAHINHFDQVLSSMFLLVNLITGSVFLTLTHIYSLTNSFILSCCFFTVVVFFVLFPIQLQIFVPSNSALKPFWGSSTYHTDNFLYINDNIKK